MNECCKKALDVCRFHEKHAFDSFCCGDVLRKKPTDLSAMSDALPADPAEGDGSGEGAGGAMEKTLSNNGPPGVVWSPVALPPSPGTPSAGTPGNVTSSREGISGDQSCVKGLHNPYHMHEVRFMGISGNPVRRVNCLLYTS